MLKVLISPYAGGSIAHVVRCLAIADSLRKHGHKILFSTTQTRKPFINQAGYDVFGRGHADVNLNDEKDQTIGYFKTHHSQFIDWLNDEIKAAEFFKPDIIVNSPSFFGPLVAHKLKIPYIGVINAQWLMEFKGLLGLGKSENRLDHAILRRIGKPIFAKRFDDVYMAQIKDFYSQLKIPYIPEKRIDLHRHNPFLIPGIPEFEPIETGKRSDVHYIGPLFWRGFEKEKFDPAELFTDFGKKPLVYVSLGGSIFRKKSYDQLIEALIKQQDWNILLSLGPNFPRSLFPADRPHCVIRSFVPGLLACQYADLVINTASHGTVMQALWHGKPLVVVPYNIDQATIANRLVELGLGINLNVIGLRDFSNREEYFRKATAVTWEQVVNSAVNVLSNTSFKDRAKEFKHKIRSYDKADELAVKYIEKYAKVG